MFRSDNNIVKIMHALFQFLQQLLMMEELFLEIASLLAHLVVKIWWRCCWSAREWWWLWRGRRCRKWSEFIITLVSPSGTSQFEYFHHFPIFSSETRRFWGAFVFLGTYGNRKISRDFVIPLEVQDGLKDTRNISAGEKVMIFLVYTEWAIE